MLRNCNVIGSTCGKGTCWEYNMKFESFVKAADSIVKPWRNVSCFQAESMYINVHKSAGNMVTLLDLLHLVLKMTVCKVCGVVCYGDCNNHHTTSHAPCMPLGEKKPSFV